MPPRPNPSHDLATIELEIPVAGPVEVAVFDVAGRLVRELVRRPMSPGPHRIRWDLADRGAHRVGAGVYFVRVTAAENQAMQKLVAIPQR